MKNLKDIVLERLVLSKNKSQDIPWEDFCEALANYLPRKNAKSNTIFVKNTGISEDIYINSDFRKDKDGEAKDKLICITAIKNSRNSSIRLSVGSIAARNTTFISDDEANCYTFVEAFDEFKEMFKENYSEVMTEFYKTAMKKQR